MDIIIFPAVSEGRSRVHLRSRTLFMGLLFILALGMLVVYGSYRLGTQAQWVAQQKLRTQVKTLARDWQMVLERQQSLLAKATYRAEKGLSTLAQRVGRLQAEVIRLNALGGRLITHAGLEEGEFDFAQSPPVGGPETPFAEKALNLNDFLATMERLEQKITDRQQQLGLLETVLIERDRRQAALPTGRPLRGGWISSRYGYRIDPFSGQRVFHSGVDFAGKAGTKVLAVAAGIVTWAGKNRGYGKVVEINHGNGYVTRYAHNQKILVQVGESVTKGQSIALMGSTGRSTGPHVHLEVLHKGRSVDPLRFVNTVKDPPPQG